MAHAAAAEPVRVEGRRVHDYEAQQAQAGATVHVRLSSMMCASVLIAFVSWQDIAIPGKKSPRRKLPTCVFVHGGSWQRGDKAGALNNGIDQAFVRAGYVGVSVNYRLSPEVRTSVANGSGVGIRQSSESSMLSRDCITITGSTSRAYARCCSSCAMDPQQH